MARCVRYAGAAAHAAHGGVELAAAGAVLAGALDQPRAAWGPQERRRHRRPQDGVPALRCLLHQRPRGRNTGAALCIPLAEIYALTQSPFLPRRRSWRLLTQSSGRKCQEHGYHLRLGKMKTKGKSSFLARLQAGF